MVGGFVCKKGKQEGSFWKKGCKGRDFLVIRGKVGGFGQKALLLSLPMLENRGGAARRRRRVAGGARAAALGLGGGHGEGEMGEKTSGNPFPTLIWAGAQRGGRSTAACGNG